MRWEDGLALATVVVALGFTASAARAAGQPAASPPNIVLILSDDQGWMDYGFMGHPHIRTPHLDRLANCGVTFKRGYVTTGVCRPSLMTLATGLYPHEHGITGNKPSSKLVPGSESYNECRATLITYIKRFDTLPALLTERGYLTHQSGKWWEGSYSNGGFTHGMTRGFSKPSRGADDGEQKIANWRATQESYYERHVRVPWGGDSGLRIGREGMKPVEQFVDMAIAKRKPFFLWYAPWMPHRPHNPPERLLAKYSAAGLPGPVAEYYAMCEWLDETCGQLIDYLEKKRVRDNTLIVYLTDNGWIQNPKKTDYYLPGSKASPYEGGVRTPILFSWPGRLGPADREEVISAIDVMPTILAAAGAKIPDDLPGLNLLPHLETGTPIEREMVFGEDFGFEILDVNDPEASLKFRWCIAGKWKLVLRYQPDCRTTKGAQLFNLLDDPHEKHNLAASHPEVVARLAKAIADWYPVTRDFMQQENE